MVKICAIYKGREYRAVQQENNKYKIYSSHALEGSKKKVLRNNKIQYIKLVDLDKLDEVKEVRSLCEYKGNDYEYYDNDNNTIRLITTNHTDDIVENSESLGHGEYWSEDINKNNVIFFEEITPIYPERKPSFKEYSQIKTIRAKVKEVVQRCFGAKTSIKPLYKIKSDTLSHTKEYDTPSLSLEF